MNIYSAEDTTLDRSVLITEYSPVGACRFETSEVWCSPQDKVSYQKGLDNFLRSGTLLAKCIERVPAVPSVFDVFQANSTGYIVEKYIDGISSEQILRSEGPIPVGLLFSCLADWLSSGRGTPLPRHREQKAEFSQLEKTLTPRQTQVIIKGLSPHSKDRWQSVEEFWPALCGSGTEEANVTDEQRSDSAGNRDLSSKPLAVCKLLRKGRGKKQISILNFLAAAIILGGLVAGVCWFNRPEPLNPEQERQAMLMELGGFRSGELSYEVIIPDVPTVWISGYAGTDTEVTIPEEVKGFPVAGASMFALKESGLETVSLPDSFTYDPNSFLEGCTVIGGKPKESGGSSLEQQLEEAAGPAGIE